MYHPAVNFALPLSIPNRTLVTYLRTLNSKHADYLAINDYLSQIDWDSAISNKSIDSAVDFLYSHLDFAITSFVPSCSIIKSSYPVWLTKELVALTKAKKSAHASFKKTLNYKDYIIFSHLRAKCKHLSTIC